jgi:hypothetical protein
VPLRAFGGSFEARIFFGTNDLPGTPTVHHPLTREGFANQTNPYQTRMGKRRIKTILDHFRTTHARQIAISRMKKNWKALPTKYIK